jgi:hypothetical protein
MSKTMLACRPWRCFSATTTTLSVPGSCDLATLPLIRWTFSSSRPSSKLLVAARGDIDVRYKLGFRAFSRT